MSRILCGVLILVCGLLHGCGGNRNPENHPQILPPSPETWKSLRTYLCRPDIEDAESCFLLNPNKNSTINKPRQLLVLVHGITGSGASTWRKWPELIWKDEDLNTKEDPNNFAIYRVNYLNPLFSDAPNIYEIAKKRTGKATRSPWI